MSKVSSKPISIIVAIAKNYAIGKDNDLLWHIPDDLKRFKRITEGHKIIMGKRTYYSLPVRPLKNRTNVVLTDIPGEQIDGCEMVYSIEEAIEVCDSDKENFIIGGGSVYRQFMEVANKLYITWVEKDFEADTFFSDIDGDFWEEIKRVSKPYDEKLGFSYAYVTYLRRKKQDDGNV
jgi:dihydrofolate reductase